MYKLIKHIAPILGSVMLSTTLLAANPLENKSVRIIINPNLYESIPAVVMSELKPLFKPHANEAVIENAPFANFDIRISDSGKITISAFKPTVAIHGEEVGGYTSGLEHRATFSSADLLKLGVSEIQISRRNIAEGLPFELLRHLKKNYTLDKHMSVEPIAPFIDTIEVHITGKSILVTARAVAGYLREYFDGEVSGIVGGATLEGTFSLREYESFIGPKAPSGYLVAAAKPQGTKQCSKLFGPVLQ